MENICGFNCVEVSIEEASEVLHGDIVDKAIELSRLPKLLEIVIDLGRDGKTPRGGLVVIDGFTFDNEMYDEETFEFECYINDNYYNPVKLGHDIGFDYTQFVYGADAKIVSTFCKDEPCLVISSGKVYKRLN